MKEVGRCIHAVEFPKTDLKQPDGGEKLLADHHVLQGRRHAILRGPSVLNGFGRRRTHLRLVFAFARVLRLSTFYYLLASL